MADAKKNELELYRYVIADGKRRKLDNNEKATGAKWFCRVRKDGVSKAKSFTTKDAAKKWHHRTVNAI